MLARNCPTSQVLHLRGEMRQSTRFTLLVVLVTASVMYMFGQVTFQGSRVSSRSLYVAKKATELQAQRRLLVRDGCKSYSNEKKQAEMEQHFGIRNLPGGLLDNIVVIDKYKLLYCFVPKVNGYFKKLF